MAERTLYVAQKGKVTPWSIPKRDLKEGEVRVEVYSVGINPVDWKTIENALADGAGQGNDFAGVVVEVGPNVSSVKIGDTVGGGVGGGDVDKKENGSFTDLLTVDEHLLFKFPTKLEPAKDSSSELTKPGLPTTFERAASLGIAVVTTALAFESHKPKQPNSEYVVIYGLTGSVGFIAAQYARNIGYKVIGVSSELKGVSDSLEGVHWIDRKDPEWVSKAQKIAGSAPITLTLDAISTDDEVKDMFAVTSKNGYVQFLLPLQVPEDVKQQHPDISIEFPVYFFLMQEAKKFGTTRVPDPKETIKRAPQIVGEINEQFAKNAIVTLPVTVYHGFDKITEGLNKNKQGVRGTKVVVDRL